MVATRVRKFAAVALVTGLALLLLGVLGLPELAAARSRSGERAEAERVPTIVEQNSQRMLKEGEQTFRFDTFGSEQFFSAIGLHKAIEGSAFPGGVGGGVSPRTALAVGLKVDVDALPASLREDIKRGRVDLDNPAVTLKLLQLDAVV